MGGGGPRRTACAAILERASQAATACTTTGPQGEGWGTGRGRSDGRSPGRPDTHPAGGGLLAARLPSSPTTASPTSRVTLRCCSMAAAAPGRQGATVRPASTGRAGRWGAEGITPQEGPRGHRALHAAGGRRGGREPSACAGPRRAWGSPSPPPPLLLRVPAQQLLALAAAEARANRGRESHRALRAASAPADPLPPAPFPPETPRAPQTGRYAAPTQRPFGDSGSFSLNFERGDVGRGKTRWRRAEGGKKGRRVNVASELEA